jgi:hypothetical protein
MVVKHFMTLGPTILFQKMNVELWLLALPTNIRLGWKGLPGKIL